MEHRGGWQRRAAAWLETPGLLLPSCSFKNWGNVHFQQREVVQNLKTRIRKLLALRFVRCLSMDVPPRMLFAFQLPSRPGYNLVCVLWALIVLWVF